MLHKAALTLFLNRLDQLTQQELTEDLGRFTLESKDCNHKKVRVRVVALLRELAEADGLLHEMELPTINHVAECLPKIRGFSFHGGSRELDADRPKCHSNCLSF